MFKELNKQKDEFWKNHEARMKELNEKIAELNQETEEIKESKTFVTENDADDLFRSFEEFYNDYERRHGYVE